MLAGPEVSLLPEAGLVLVAWGAAPVRCVAVAPRSAPRGLSRLRCWGVSGMWPAEHHGANTGLVGVITFIQVFHLSSRDQRPKIPKSLQINSFSKYRDNWNHPAEASTLPPAPSAKQSVTPATQSKTRKGTAAKAPRAPAAERRGGGRCCHYSSSPEDSLSNV